MTAFFNRLNRPLLALSLGLIVLFAASFAYASTLKAFSLDELSVASPTIVRGTVVETRSERDAESGKIYTYTTIEVAESYKGKAPERLTLRQIGGTVDGVTLAIPGSPSFKQGEEVLVFTFSVPGKSAYRGLHFLKGMAQGKYRITTDPESGQRLAVRDMAGASLYVENASGVRGELVTQKAPLSLPLTELETRIRQAISRAN